MAAFCEVEIREAQGAETPANNPFSQELLFTSSQLSQLGPPECWNFIQGAKGSYEEDLLSELSDLFAGKASPCCS